MSTVFIDRKAASKLLKLSVRTVDRYAKAGKLSTKVENGRILFDKGELMRFKGGGQSGHRVDNVDMSSVDLSIDTEVDNVDRIVHNLSTRVDRTPQKTYEKLYTDLKDELREKQERLEIANYRVGQLEAQLKNSMPMLEYRQERFEGKQKEEQLREQLKTSNSLMQRISNQLKYEQLSKRIFVVTLLTILALQPLWLILLSNGS